MRQRRQIGDRHEVFGDGRDLRIGLSVAIANSHEQRFVAGQDGGDRRHHCVEVDRTLKPQRKHDVWHAPALSDLVQEPEALLHGRKGERRRPRDVGKLPVIGALRTSVRKRAIISSRWDTIAGLEGIVQRPFWGTDPEPPVLDR